MRRIYESSALRRDDSDPFAPHEGAGGDRPRAMRSLPAVWLSRRLLPDSFRNRLLSISIETERSEYPQRVHIPFRVQLRNVAPFPVTLDTRSSILWTWDVDGLPEASKIGDTDIEGEPDYYTFDRGQRVILNRRWDGMFKIADDEWEWAEPGEYSINVQFNVDGAVEKGLADSTTVSIVPR